MNSSEIILLVSLIIGFDIFVVIAILRVRAKKRRAGGALQRVADEEGWVATTRDGGFDYTGSTTSGHAWQLQSSKSGSVWRCAEVGLSDQIIALGPFRGLYEKLGGDTDVDLGHPMIRAALARMFSPARAERLATARMVDLNSALPDGFALFTDTEDLSRRFLADPVTPLLEEWLPAPGTPRRLYLMTMDSRSASRKDSTRPRNGDRLSRWGVCWRCGLGSFGLRLISRTTSLGDAFSSSERLL